MSRLAGWCIRGLPPPLSHTHTLFSLSHTRTHPPLPLSLSPSHTPTTTHRTRGVVRGGGDEQPGGVRLPEEPCHTAQRLALADRRVLSRSERGRGGREWVGVVGVLLCAHAPSCCCCCCCLVFGDWPLIHSIPCFASWWTGLTQATSRGWASSGRSRGR